MALPPPVSLLHPFLNHPVLRPQVVQSKKAPTLGVGRLGEQRPKQVSEPAQGEELSMGEGTPGLTSRGKWHDSVMILKDHNNSLGCYLVICSHQIDYFWEKSGSRLIRWKILTVAQVRGDDGLGSGSINNRRERVNGSKNKNRKHFTDKQLCGYKQPSPTKAFVLFLFGVGGGRAWYT